MPYKRYSELAKTLTMKTMSFTIMTNILRYLHKLDENINIGNMTINKNTNIYNILPKETWIQILLDVNCSDLDDFSDKSPQFKQLIIENNIKEIVKMKGFPRKSGHCKSYAVSALYDDDEKDHYDANTLRTKVLGRLHNLNYDLVRGDLILFEGFDGYRNDGVDIYDGCKIINLDYDIDDYGALPKEFTVIKNGVPVDYWYNYNENEDQKGVDHNQIIWINISEVKQQCIDNIIEIDGDLYTTFIYDNKEYKIYAHHDGNKITFTIDQFKDILVNNDVLLSDYQNEDDFDELDLAGYYYEQQ
jgi:hypothetical protein